ncbi:aminotransferase class I/II-fold pyridoxal phosphate-dependent enzyme [Nonomuraea phyllanthi]|uniref:8-amino-7-oxononanoate synthase n=1 Tax=Nonomuraea phyllanthi TaxID=2219224 RepID=A0A5C4WT14_9ACTN|nr:aminotransferase class I/II-fold pyridoxal phosphate-dependent enzyme [Nonomuraea phyllanthi]KAB8196781.1 aminotransferase class I/II-fold pyridoxal phosphate-dependent enzyme [Nonomuraea phyllanthi]
MLDAFGKCRPRPDQLVAIGSETYPYYRPVTERLDDGEVVIGGRAVLMAGSNDYLALSDDPRLKAAATEALDRHGTGNSGSRLLNGSLPLHEELEAELAAFLGMEAAMVVSTGYQANLTLSALFAHQDVVYADRLVHASLMDAVRLGHARLVRYRHNDLAHLERLLKAADPRDGRLVLSEGMFSTDGDLCDVPGIARLARRHDARLILDCAHDAGLLGVGGRGAAEQLGRQAAVDVQTLTFSKCFGTLGGAVAGPRHVIDYLRHHARPAVFTASLPAGCAAAALAALRIIRTEPERRRRALAAGERLRAELAALGFGTAPGIAPAMAIPVGDTALCARMWKELLDEGVYTNAMVPPGVPEGKALIRLSVTAAHTDAQLTRIVDACTAAGRRLGLIAATQDGTAPLSLVTP